MSIRAALSASAIAVEKRLIDHECSHALTRFRTTGCTQAALLSGLSEVNVIFRSKNPDAFTELAVSSAGIFSDYPETVPAYGAILDTIARHHEEDLGRADSDSSRVIRAAHTLPPHRITRALAIAKTAAQRIAATNLSAMAGLLVGPAPHGSLADRVRLRGLEPHQAAILTPAVLAGHYAPRIVNFEQWITKPEK